VPWKREEVLLQAPIQAQHGEQRRFGPNSERTLLCRVVQRRGALGVRHPGSPPRPSRYPRTLSSPLTAAE
jgi:hypothetical protein